MSKDDLIIGDLHFGLEYKGIDFNERISERMSDVFESIKKEPVDKIIFLGDLVHIAALSIDTFYFVIYWVKKLKKYSNVIYLIQGNHDGKLSRNDEKTLFELMDIIFDYEKGIMFFIDLKIIKVNKKLRFLFIPFIERLMLEKLNIKDSPQKYIEDKLKKKLKKIPKDKSIIVFSHLNFLGAKDGGGTELPVHNDLFIPQFLLKDKRVKKVFNGHVHSPQELGKLIVPGSLETLRYGEGIKRFFIRVNYEN